MKITKFFKRSKNRDGEKGAAMVTVLMITFVLLVASTGLLLEASMNSGNVTDATAEQQAYNAAESGIQTALHILRGKDINSGVSFVDALKSPDLSSWLTYGSTCRKSCVPIGDLTKGYGFNLSIVDPDNTGDSVNFSTDATIDGKTGVVTIPDKDGRSGHYVSIYFSKKGPISVSTSGTGKASSDLGSFFVSVFGSPVINDTRFSIVYEMFSPYEANRVARGYIKGGSIASTSDVIFQFDSPAYKLMGSTITLKPDSGRTIDASGNVTGYKIQGKEGKTLSPEKISVNCEIEPVEPHRVLLTSRGYGPRGAEKQLEAIVQKNFFNGLTAPATLTMIGPPGDFNFVPGSSQNVTYSGNDAANKNIIIPPVGTDNADNLKKVQDAFAEKGSKADVTGEPSDITVERPDWLKTADKLDKAVEMLKDAAKSSGTYTTTAPNIIGNATGTGITFIDADVTLNPTQSGGGILVVTGKLTLKGDFDFKGLIIVTGAGGLERSGGGGGVLEGNVVIAPYYYDETAKTHKFTSPKYAITGGGTSEIIYNSSSVSDGLKAVSNFVLGVVEK